MENKVYCKAEINKKTNIFVMLPIAVISLIAWIMMFVPVRSEKSEYGRFDIYYGYNIYGYKIGEKFDNEWEYYHFNDPGSYILTAVCAFFILSFIYLLCCRITSKQCALELNQDGIFGRKKTLFSLKSINQPFEKIDNIYVGDSIIDKLLGGKTVAIRSASSCIRFPCIANAQEFVDKTLEELKKYKESLNSNKEKASAASDGDAMESILKLKNLLDQGLISQEEFEEKRKSFINKI